jgi:hypothetical protein
MDERQTEWIRSANEMIDWFADNPEMIPFASIRLHRWYWDWDFRAKTDEQSDLTSDRVQRLLAAMREDAGVLRANTPIGSVEKIDLDSTYGVSRKFGVHEFSLATAASATCTMVETEEVKDVVSYEIPADVYEKYKVVQKQPVMKKVCPPITNREL